MKPMTGISGVVLCLYLTLSVASEATASSDWPTFRGPNGNGIAGPDPILPLWGDAGPPELWRREIGAGWSSFAVLGLYTLAAEGEIEEVLCLDAKTGKTLWRAPLGKRFEGQFGDGPRATPTLDGDIVYAVGSDMVLAAVSRTDGSLQWKHDLKKMFGAPQPRFGYAVSPMIDGDLLILEVGRPGGRRRPGTPEPPAPEEPASDLAAKHKGSVMAFDKKTGEPKWSYLDGPAGSSTPILVEIGGKRQYVFHRLTGSAGPSVFGMEIDTGEVLWRHPIGEDTIVSPLFIAPDKFFASSAQRGKGGLMIRVSAGESGEFETEEIWTERKMRNHFNNSVAVDNHVYGFDNSTLRCLDATTGKIVWSQRGFGKGSLIAHGDRLIVLGDQGLLALVEATPDEYRELGRVRAMKGRAWTSPTLANGRLIVRDLDEIVAYDVRGTEATGAIASAGKKSTTTMVPDDRPLELDAVLDRYRKARGGTKGWDGIESMELTGTFSVFSEGAPFKLVRKRGDVYRFEFTAMGKSDARGRDSEGAWWIYNLFQITDAARVGIPQYTIQLDREARFEPPLLRAKENDIEVKLIGRGDVDGRATIDLELVYPDASIETWKLDALTYREVAIDSTVYDFSQGQEAMPQRTYFSDYRPVGGVVVPFRQTMEFGARLEEMTVDAVKMNPTLEDDFFTMPGPTASEEDGGGN